MDPGPPAPHPHPGTVEPFPVWSNDRVLYADVPARTAANAAAIEGFFAAMWFGWGQEGPPDGVSIILVVGFFLAVIVFIGGLGSAYSARGEPDPLAGGGAGRKYGITVATEFGLIGLGAVILGTTGHADFVAAWICVVVGVHFVPLGRVFPGIGMVTLAAVVTAVGIVAVAVGVTTDLLPSTITGLGAGTCLLVHGGSLLIRRGVPSPRTPGP